MAVKASAKALKKALDMSKAARMKRAREMGFDTDKVYYHGTDRKFDEFIPGSAEGWGEGVYFSDHKPDTEEFGETVYETLLALKNPYKGEKISDSAIEGTPAFKAAAKKEIDLERNQLPEGMTDDEILGEIDLDPWGMFQDDGAFANKVLRDLGYDGIMTKGSNSLQGTETVVFNPSNIRSVNAAFDPAKADSPNLLASAAPLAVGAGLLGQSDDADANPLQAALKKALDMSKAARMKRAREMGFDVDRPLYHHTNAPDIEAFRPSERGKLGAGVYFSPSPNYGSRYVDEEGANVIPAFASGKLAKVGDIDKASDLSKAEQSGSDFSVKQWKQRTDEILREQGFSGKEVGDEVLVFNPSNIRSVNAAFDPAKADSPNLLASAAPLAVGAGLLGQSDDADANPLQAVLKTIAREGLPKNTIERVIQRYPELAKGDGVNLTGPQKSEITRFTKSLGNPAVRRREALRNTGDTYGQVEDLPDRNIIRPSDLMGNVLVPTVGDRSRTGVVLNDVGGVPLDRPVAIEGGPDFTRQRHGTGLGWASMKGAAAGKQANIDKAAEATDLPPVGVYSAMGLDAINFSTPVAESMVAQIPALRIPQKDIQAFNNQVRKVAPDFVGLDSPDVMDQIMGRGEFPMEGAGALRKAVVGEMSKASWANKGFPRYEDVDAAVNMPELRGLNVGDSGYSMYNAIPGADIIEGAGHQSYSHGIAGDYAGGFDVSVPPNIMFPKTFNSLSQKINVAGDPLTWDQQVGSLRSAHLWEVPDQQWVDNVSDYMMRHGSKNYGSANPYYLAGLATGTATLPTAMEQLQLGNPQPQAEAVPARFPMLHNIANKIDNYQDPTGLLLNTSGTADWLRQFGERGNPYDKLLSAFGAAPF